MFWSIQNRTYVLWYNQIFYLFKMGTNKIYYGFVTAD
ncbi:hypothetical protein PL2TA16_02413 [Pseudoalteromonas luteoviolacea 2ta16]|uniref:Uncharacterized protein n=1 Tax=Pseudoalteromonas luteoviolacea (strain 2ta16) TaxID=1353533 RepID=V4HWI2_PSEL2|nr:hypothetical protein PL2TA16_02413 [Pseudoalteromonas luteoviolacea 2ta16]